MRTYSIQLFFSPKIIVTHNVKNLKIPQWIYNYFCYLRNIYSYRDHLAFDRSLARNDSVYTWDRFRINEQTCQVDTLVWFSWYMAVIARWGMARWNSNEVSLTMGDGRRAKSAKSFEQSRFTVILYTPVPRVLERRDFCTMPMYFTTHQSN